MPRPSSQTPGQQDLIDCLLEKVAHELGLPTEQLDMVDSWARQTFGGELFYLPRVSTRKRSDRRQQIAEAYNGRNMAEVTRRFGVSKTTVFECVKRCRKSPGF